MIQPPYWLIDKSVDLMRVTEHDKIRREFMEAFTAEEERLFPKPTARIGCTGWFGGCYGTGVDEADFLLFACVYVSDGLVCFVLRTHPIPSNGRGYCS